MPNWCSNEIELKGSRESIDKVLSFIIDGKKVVDFNIIKAMPKELLGIYDQKSEIYELRKSNPDRLGLLTITELSKKIEGFALNKEEDARVANVAAMNRLLISWQYAADTIKEIIDSGVFSGEDSNKPVETLIENHKNQAGSQLIHNNQCECDAITDKLLDILSRGNADHCMQEYGYITWYGWAYANWGTKWNGDGYPVDTVDFDGGLSLFFSTAWSCPDQWFSALCSKINEAEKAEGNLDISVKLTYAEGGNWFGGHIKRDTNGEIYEYTMSDDEVGDYLDIPQEEYR